MTVSMRDPGIAQVNDCTRLLENTLVRLEGSKERDIVATPIKRAEIKDLPTEIAKLFAHIPSDARKRTQYAVLDISARNTFNHILVSVAPHTLSADLTSIVHRCYWRPLLPRVMGFAGHHIHSL